MPELQTVTAEQPLVLNTEAMENLKSIALTMSNGVSTIPKHLQGHPSDCLAVVMQAAKFGMDPYVVAQKTHLVNGSLGYEAQLVNAIVTSSSAIDGRFHYEYQGSGNSLQCRVGAKIKGEDDITWLHWIKSSDQKVKNSPLWQTDPQQQMAYLCVKKWARLYTPHVILGVYTPDELHEAAHKPQMRDMGDIPEENKSRSEALKDRLRPKPEPEPEAQPAPSDDVQRFTNPETGEILTVGDVLDDLDNCETPQDLDALKAFMRTFWKELNDEDQAKLTTAMDSATSAVMPKDGE